MIDTLLEVMPHFPVLGSAGLNLGRSPRDIAGGAYYMNPEELPFEALLAGDASEPLGKEPRDAGPRLKPVPQPLPAQNTLPPVPGTSPRDHREHLRERLHARREAPVRHLDDLGCPAPWVSGGQATSRASAVVTPRPRPDCAGCRSR